MLEDNEHTSQPNFSHIEKALICHGLIEYKLVPTFKENEEIPKIYLDIAKRLLDPSKTKLKDNPKDQRDLLQLLARARGIDTLIDQKNYYVSVAEFLDVPSNLMIPGYVFSLKMEIGFFISKHKVLREKKYGEPLTDVIKQARDIIKADSFFFLEDKCKNTTWCTSHTVVSKIIEEIVNGTDRSKFSLHLLLATVLKRSELSVIFVQNEVSLNDLPKESLENYEDYKNNYLVREQERSHTTPISNQNPYTLPPTEVLQSHKCIIA